MEDNAVTVSRRLLPRWRTLARTPANELPASRMPTKEKAERTSVPMRSALGRWKETPSLINASEVIDAALVTGQYSLATPAALAVLKDGNGVDGLNDAARQVLGEISDRPVADLNAADERDVEKIAKKIGSLKWRLNAAPRDALAALEIARLQSLIGQTSSAERYIERAVKSAPNDRYVLRSAARFWAHRSKRGDEQVNRALEVIWASDVVRVDPWVQAAEVSVANICGKTPRWGVRTGKDIYNSEPNLVQYSELASGLATLELHSGGALKKVRKFTKISLRAPTENSVAQAMWSGREIGVNFDVSRFLTLPNANEARARAAYEVDDYQTSATECWNWLEDESFSARAALMGAFVNSSLLGRYDKSLAFAEQGLRANPSVPALMNSKIFSLVYLGKVEKAAEYLPQLEAFEHQGRMRAFVDAARGLIAFRRGDFMGGRAFYERAIKDCDELGDVGLKANATIYWLEQELFAGTTNAEDALKTVARLDEFFTRKEGKAAKSPVWTARKKVITHLLYETAKRQAVLTAVENLKAELPLLFH